jgi:putative transcriptional regulator
MHAEYLHNQLLVAMPTLSDPNFAQTVTLICEHTARGALGIVLNRPLTMQLGEVFEQLDLHPEDPALRTQRVLRGGPVQCDRGFVLHGPGHAWDSTLRVSDQVCVTMSRDILTAMAQGTGPATAVMALGYAGWEAGQLEDEIRSNTWLNVPVDESIIFSVPYEQRWQSAARLLGVDLGRIATQAGHA